MDFKRMQAHNLQWKDNHLFWINLVLWKTCSIFLFFLISKTCIIEPFNITLYNEDKSHTFNSEWKKPDIMLLILHSFIYKNDINKWHWSLLTWVKTVGYHQGVDGDYLEGNEGGHISRILVMFCFLIQVMLHTSIHFVKIQQGFQYFICILWYILLKLK